MDSLNPSVLRPPSQDSEFYSHTEDYFLVCGLGSLGQQCVTILREFGGRVSAIDQHQPDNWDIPDIPECLDRLWIGDCQQTDVLKQAEIDRCRAILLVTSNEQVNIETAFAVRLLNPAVRLVVRSAKQNLNQLLEQQLGNFVAFEPTQLSAHAFALAAMDRDILGFFNLDGEQFRVVHYTIQIGHRWCNARRVYELNSSSRRVLLHRSVTDPVTDLHQFHQWNPMDRILAGDEVVTLERFQGHGSERTASTQSSSIFEKVRLALRRLQPPLLRQYIEQFQKNIQGNQIQRVVMICGLTILGLVVLGTALFWRNYPNLNVLDAFVATAVLLLGGFGDLFSELTIANSGIPQWLRLFGLFLTLAGTAFVGVIYALLTEKLLTLRLQFLSRRPPIPTQNHSIVIGLGQVGEQVIALLQELKQSVVGITDSQIPQATFLPQTPIVFASQNTALTKVNLESAKSVVAVTADEMQNLEFGLMAHAVNPDCRLVIRTYNRRFNDNVARLFPYAHVLCVSALSAEAFAVAAFGENVLNLFRLQNRTILVTEYQIESDDTLNGLLLSEVSYGYGVVAIMHQRGDSGSWTTMPSDDSRLQVGDRLVVLATTTSLQRIERGEMAPRQWGIWIERLLSPTAAFDAGSELARVSGCDLNLARTVIDQIPTQFPVALYKHQALRLVRRLNKLQVMAQMRSFEVIQSLDTTR